MTLIPTARKERLPKGFSYPLGAEAISAAFAGVPQLENASLWFSWRDQYWSSEWRRKFDGLGEVTLLAIADRHLSPGGDIRLYAVPSEFSVAAREHLTAELPRLCRALRAVGSRSRLPRMSVTMSLGVAAKKAAKQIDGAR